MSDDPDDDDHGGDIRDYIDTQGHWLDYTIKHEFSSSKPPARLVRFMPIEQYLSILTTRGTRTFLATSSGCNHSDLDKQ